MSAVWGDDDAEEWLEGVHGVGALECSCPDPIKELLLQGWKDGEWTQDDVQDQTTGFVASRDLEVWEAIIDECIKTKPPTPPIKKPDRKRFEKWLKAIGTTGDGTTSYVPSAACLKDMADQGAKSVRDILFTEVSLHTGRPAGATDLVGAEYKVPASVSSGGRLAVKTKSETFDSALERSEKQGNMATLETFIQELCHQLSNCDDPFGERASSNITQWWGRGTRTMKAFGVKAQLMYFREFRGMYKGRGFPVFYDSEIVTRAMGMSGEGAIPGSSGADKKDASKDEAKLDKLIAATSEMNSTVGSLSNEVKSIRGEVNLIKKQVGMDGNLPRCNYCKQLGHIKDNCPELQKKLLDEANAAKK